MQREMYYDRKYIASLEAVTEGAAGGEGGGLGDLGGDDLGDLGGDDLGDDLGGGDEPVADEEEDIILAEPPAKRDDEPSYKRGKYKRHKTSYSKGGRQKHFKNQATGEYGNTYRTTFQGKSGFGGLDSLAKGITERNVQNEIEEEKLFTTSKQVDILLEGLLKTTEKENS